MRYTIHENSENINDNDREFIDSRVGLSLSRFNNITSSFDIVFDKLDNGKSPLTSCTICIKMTNATDIVVTDSANSIQQAFLITLNRVKRNIERQLKRSKGSRLGPSLNARQ
ncbi:hypothetical protein [Glaciecola petra]|uniref:Ribosomal subunit interface protein n=1 Tax=Glaciecola petra TaxID=3075602 RepID=A0ABU2ZQ08_9ALTE|nr:hypothetical protein [Aestuariibacter sp. P117]MDT0594501.1 hypothetical protein [Aestuariibacter sp. P117]